MGPCVAYCPCMRACMYLCMCACACSCVLCTVGVCVLSVCLVGPWWERNSFEGTRCGALVKKRFTDTVS